MNPFHSFDAAALARADEQTLELRRRLAVVEADDRRELVIDCLLVRALPAIVEHATRLAAAAGLSREQTMAAAEEASVTLQMRLRSPEKLLPVRAMARKLAAEAVDARADQAPSIEQPGTSPRLVSRSPDLRAIDGGADDPTAPEDDATSTSPGDGEPPSIHDQLGDALRRRQIKPNDAEKS